MLISLLLEPRLRWPVGELRPPPAGFADVPSGNCLAETTYAVFKPRNVLSVAGRDPEGADRATLTNIMVDAGVPPLSGHVGRLDYETSGLILVTAHGLLKQALINWPVLACWLPMEARPFQSGTCSSSPASTTPIHRDWPG